MLAALILISNIAFAQVTCVSASGAKNLVACGDERVPTYTQKNQKVQSITLLFENLQRGFERRVEVKNPGLTVAQINTEMLSQSSAVKKEIEKIKKEWDLKDVKIQIVNFNFDKKTALFASADFKTKMATTKVVSKIHRSVASESPLAGGIRSAKDEKSK